MVQVVFGAFQILPGLLPFRSRGRHIAFGGGRFGGFGFFAGRGCGGRRLCGGVGFGEGLAVFAVLAGHGGGGVTQNIRSFCKTAADFVVALLKFQTGDLSGPELVGGQFELFVVTLGGHFGGGGGAVHAGRLGAQLPVVTFHVSRITLFSLGFAVNIAAHSADCAAGGGSGHRALHLAGGKPADERSQ